MAITTKTIAVIAVILLVVGFAAGWFLITPTLKPIKLGHIGDYSSMCEMYSTSEKKGQLLAVEEINAAGGILGRQLEYLDRDGALNVDISVRELKDLILSEKIDFALGPCSSSEALALQAVTGDYNIIRVSSIACTEAQTVDNYNGTTLQVVVNSYMEGRGQARRIHRDFPNAKKFYCFNQDYEFGYREQAAFEEEIKRLVLDAVIVGKAFPKLGETDYSPFITAMLAMKDDIDFVQSSLYGDDLVAFTKQAKGYGFFDELPFMALYDIDVLRALGKDAPEGVYGFARGDFFADPNPKMMEFVEKYRAKYNGEYPSGWAVLGYDAIYALKAAIEKAGTTDTDAVREALKGMDFTGLRGHTPVRAIDLMMVAPTYNGIITHESPYPFPIWRDVWRIDGAEVIRSEESVLEVRAALREPGLKVAVLHYGPIGDYGWTYEAHLGAQKMAEALPYVELSERENASGPDSPQILREYAEAGNKVIFCHGWDLGIEEVAPNYPDVIFMWGGGVEKKAPNTGIYYGRMYEASFLAGIVAGAMTETNKIGYAASIPIPGVVRGIDAFAKGAASVNPDAEVYVEWIGEWYDPPKEKEVALSLIDKGCDIITHRSDSYAPAEAAEERGVYFISQYSDMRRFAPHVFLTGTVWNWAPIMTDIVNAVREGTWDEHPDQDWWYGLAEGGVKLAPFSDLVPDDVKEMVEEKKQAIIEGEFEVFPGMTDEELREIYYFESNVVGELPVKEAEETIKIGAIYPLTGSLATTGADLKNGVLLAVDIINNEHKIDLPLARSKGIDSLDGAKIEIVFGDSQGSPSVGKSEVERLIDKEKVVALIGCYQSAVTAEASQVAEDKGTPFLTATSAAPSLTQRGFNWFFRTTPNDKTFVQSFYGFLQDIREEKDIKVEKLGIVYENSVWGSEFSADIRQYAEEYGYQIVENISYDSDTTNVTNEVQRLENANPDVVMQASYINDAILYMQTYKDMNFSPDAILADGVGFIELEFLQTLGDDGNYILTRATWSKDLAETKPLVGTVNQMFRERYEANMTGNSARAFTGMLVLADAINRAGSTDSDAIREALLETNLSSDKLIMPWDGVRFDHETHQNTLGKGIICQIIDQEYHTVWPWNLATKELIWPMPKWSEREKAKVAIVFDTGGLEAGFNDLCLSGAKKAEEELKIKLDYIVAKTIQEFDGLQRGYAESEDYEIIICTGSNQADALLHVAKEFPEQKFALVDGTIAESENVASFLFRDEESSFLAGALAAIVSKTNKTGFVGGMDIPAINRFLAGYYAGARYINPDCEILVSYVGSWNNPERGKELALELYDNGADIVFGAAGPSGVGVIEAAEEMDLYAIGVDTDQRDLAPENVLVSTLKRTDVEVFNVIKEAVEGDFEGGIRSRGLKEGGVGLSLDNALAIVTDEKKEKIREIREEIIDGEIGIPSNIDVDSKIGMSLMEVAI